MKHKYIFSFLLASLAIAGNSQAQNSSGKCWHIDYDQWNINTPALHILCGNNPILNVGGEMTLEMWVCAYTFGENRKVFGKVDSDGSTFNNGYVIGYQNLNVYTEVWNPATQTIPYASAGPIQLDSAYVHLSSTYSVSSGMLRDYENGELVGEVQVFPATPIVANDAQLVIGSAPWDSHAYQFYGTLDEVRIWNTAHTGNQIKSLIHKELQGNEPGLVAYYNFNTAHDSIVPDMSGNNNHGTLQNSQDNSWSWANSNAPVGDLHMYNLLEPTAAWSGKTGSEYNYAVTENGFSVIAEIGRKEFRKYILFAHTDANGVSVSNIPVDVPNGFKRSGREWYVTRSGHTVSDVFINLTQTADGGEAFPSAQDASHYALLYRPNQTTDYIAIAYPNTVFADNLIFNDLILTSGYYAIGYSTEPTPLDVENVVRSQMKIYPNPASNVVIIENAENAHITLMDASGRTLIQKRVVSDHQSINIETFCNGIYFVRIDHSDRSETIKLIVNQ